MHALLCGANDRLCNFGHADKRGSATLIRNGRSRATHINIYSVKAQFTYDMGSLVEVFGPTAKDLCHNRPFCRCVQEVTEDTITPSPESLNVGKLSEHNIRPSIEAMHRAARCIGDAIHRRKCDYRLLYGVPE